MSTNQANHQSRQEQIAHQEDAHKTSRKERSGKRNEHTKECPHCHFLLSDEADICEACGRWLLEGQCCFCYAEYKPGQKFCSNCGNPPTGANCKKCGTFSIFDICRNCGEGITKNAAKTMEALSIKVKQEAEIIDQQLLQKTTEELDAIKQYESLKKEAQKVADKEKEAEEIEKFHRASQQLDNYYAQFEETRTPKEESRREEGLFKSPGVDLSKNLEAAKNYIERIEAERKARLLAEKKEKSLSLQKKEFQTNQEARLFYDSVRQQLSALLNCPSFLGWRCEYANFVHFSGPSDCQCPSMGGRWICITEVEKMIGPYEFILEGQHYAPCHETPRTSQTN